MSKTAQMIVFIVVGFFFLSGSAASQLIFWLKIEPTLRKLGHTFDALSIRK